MASEQIRDNAIEMLYFLEYRASIDGLKMDPVYPDGRWMAECAKHGLCPLCKHVDRSQYPTPLDIALAEAPIVDDEVAFEVATTGVTIWLRSYIEMILENLREYVVGKCMLADGSVLDDFVTCYGPRYILIEAGRGAPHERCPKCGTVCSEAPVGPMYVLRSSLTDAKVYQDARCQFYMTEDVLSEYQEQLDLPLLPKGIGVRDVEVGGDIHSRDC